MSSGIADRSHAAGAAHAFDATHDPCALCGAPTGCLPGLFHGDAVSSFERMVAGKRLVERHSSLYRVGDKFDTLYIIRFGQFKEFMPDPAGNPRVVRFYMPGEIIGFDGVATGVHRSRVMALESCEVCAVPYLHLRRAMLEQPQFLDRFLATMSATLFAQHQHAQLLALPSLDGRFACFLLNLSGSYARLGFSGATFRLSMSRSDIGSYLGIAVETVSRLVARFNAQRAVLIERRMVQLLDPARLVSMIDHTPVPPGPDPTITESDEAPGPVRADCRAL